MASLLSFVRLAGDYCILCNTRIDDAIYVLSTEDKNIYDASNKNKLDIRVTRGVKIKQKKKKYIINFEAKP